MGYFDYLTCEVDIPGVGVPAGVQFQTKSIYQAGAELAITRGGRLVHHQARHEECGTREVRPGFTLPAYEKIRLGDRDLAYHGDVKFCGQLHDKPFAEYVARFTNGQLEWIRPSDELSDLHLQLLNRD